MKVRIYNYNIFLEHFNDLTKFRNGEDKKILPPSGETLSETILTYFKDGCFVEEMYYSFLDASYCIDQEPHRFLFQLFVEEDGTPTAFYGGYV